MDLISSATDFCIVVGICDYLGKINEINHESPRNTTSVVLTPRVSENVTQPRPRPCAAENVSSCAAMAEETSEQGHHLGEYLACIQRKIDGRGEPPAFTESTNKKDSCRKSERKDRELYRLCKIADYAEILKIGEFLQTRLARKQRQIAQHTLRRKCQMKK